MNSIKEYPDHISEEEFFNSFRTKDGTCSCFAHQPSECTCGAWDGTEYIDWEDFFDDVD